MSDDAHWLTLDPTNGSSTGENDDLLVSVDISGLSVGVYSSLITISAPGATNTPQTVTVTLTIESPIILLAPEDGASLPPNPPATFEWSSTEYKRFKIQFGKDSEFSGKTLIIPRKGWTKETSYTPKKRVWRIIKKVARKYGKVYWRVGGKKSGGIAFSETRSFSIEKSLNDY